MLKFSVLNNKLGKLVGFKVFVKQCSTLGKVTGELDVKFNENNYSLPLKGRTHAGSSPTKCANLPENLKKAILNVSEDTPTHQLMEECKSLARYLWSRQLPTERKILLSKLSALKQEVQGSLNVDEELLSDEQNANYKGLVDSKAKQLLKQRTYHWQPILYSRYLGLQYLFARAVAEYAVLSKIFAEIKQRDSFRPVSLFDFGSGVGTTIWAANETWGNSFKEFFCVDTSSDMLDISENLITLYNKDLLNIIFYRQFLPTSYPHYDVVVSAYSLLELPSLENRLETVGKLWNKANKFLVLIEQGTMAGFKVINEARNFIIEASKTKDFRAQIFSPCPHDLSCPMNNHQKAHCNFEVSYNPFPQKENNKRELFTYIVFSKETRKPEIEPWPRIIRPVLQRSRHVICRMCTNSGELQEITFTPTKHGRTLYKCAKISKWGDRLPLSTEDIKKISENQRELKNKE